MNTPTPTQAERLEDLVESHALAFHAAVSIPTAHDKMRAKANALMEEILAVSAQRVAEPTDLHDFVTHRAAWREAITCALAVRSDRDYWQHELVAFNKAMQAFDAHSTAEVPQVTDAEIEELLPEIRHKPGMLGYTAYSFGDVIHVARALLATQAGLTVPQTDDAALSETAAEQAAGLYAAREADIKALLDERAPGTTGNILERIKQALPKTGDPVDMLAVCAALGFDPTNHHNAAKCPYCRPAASLPIQAVPMPELPEGAILESDALVRRVKFAYPFERQAEVLKAFGSWAWPLNGPSNPDGSWQRLIAEKVVGTTQPASEPIPAAHPPGNIKPDTATHVYFYEQDFYVLSNFSAFALVWSGILFHTSEAAYHWCKFIDRDPEVQDMILEAPSAHAAFKIAESQKALRREDWDAVKVDFMRAILRAKADQHEYVRRKLLATGDRTLVEDSWRDDYWGWGPNRDGQNMLGKLWMQVRAELRAEGRTL